MSQLLIHDVDEATLAQLRERAAQHGRSIESEAKEILAQALRSSGSWARTNALREELARSGRPFPDSTALIREDRQR
jgi:plasmid stability protein